MTYEEFNAFCSALPATTHVVQWGGSQVWKVGGRVFAIGGWSSEHDTPAFTFKVSKMTFEILCDETGYRPAPYLAARGMSWIQQTSTDPKLDDDLKEQLKTSHRMVASGLSKKKQCELGLA